MFFESRSFWKIVAWDWISFCASRMPAISTSQTSVSIASRWQK